MKSKLSLLIILIISIAGIIFSGYLSYNELFKGSCLLGSCNSVKGIPACIYGLLMYFIIFLLSVAGLKGK